MNAMTFKEFLVNVNIDVANLMKEEKLKFGGVSFYIDLSNNKLNCDAVELLVKFVNAKGIKQKVVNLKL